MSDIKLVPRRTSERTGDAIWMKFECGAGSRWTSTTEDYSGTVCNFSGCNCGAIVKMVGETDDRQENWFGLRVGNMRASLIAAAPELLEALKWLRDNVVPIAKFPVEARAAIAKAEGH